MKVTIITINYNNGEGLRKTVESVINQTIQDYQYIVIDGGSTDNSTEIIKKYKNHIHYWVSEPDTGIYNAMNKGIEKAEGEYLIMINSGDILVNNDILDTVFKKNNMSDIIYGDILWNDNQIEYEEEFPENLTFQFFRTNSLGHQATFIRKSVYDRIGLYDENFEIVSDWKFLLTAICKYNVSYEHIPLLISNCGRDGISCDPANFNKISFERNEILKKEFCAYYSDYLHMDEMTSQYDRMSNLFFLRVLKKIESLFKVKN